MPKACYQCGGSGKVHRSNMSHSAGCIFCTTCAGCKGTGIIPSTATRCPKCSGQGRYHDSPMSHSAGCIFCTSCGTCKKKGWVQFNKSCLYSILILYLSNKPETASIENFAFLIRFCSGSRVQFMEVRKSAFSKLVYINIAPEKSQAVNNAAVKSVSVKSTSCSIQFIKTVFYFFSLKKEDKLILNPIN